MKNQLIIVGLVLAILGGVGLAIDSVSWNSQETLVEVGEFEASATVPQSREIPPVLAGGVLALGLVLTGIGAAKKS